MAIDKIGTKALVDCSVAAVDIKDGTITTAKLASTLDISSKTVTLPNTSVTNAQLAGSIANAKLANSTVTINGTSIALGATGSIPAISWQSVVTGDTTMVAGRGYFVNTTSGAITMTLPASASAGDTIAIKDYAGTFGSNKLTIARNGHKIQGNTNNSLIGTSRASLILVYIDATKGWLFTVESNVADLQVTQFTEATGGTVTTTGNFKVHTFTGDGCFVVSQAGIQSPAGGGPSNVDYLVIAGGGGGGRGIGGAGGGGAGGYRTTFPSPSCNAGAFPITAQTYPITVGGGGNMPSPGSPSVFSTITSAGGGTGGGPCGPAGQNGGSGGGGAGTGPGSAKGDGNTPPVSPPQGNDGGTGTYSQPNTGCTATQTGGGGGGAGGAGQSAPGPAPGPKCAGTGGSGASNSITGSGVTRAGGGGGGAADAPGGANNGNRANGGPGGGGAGTDARNAGSAGTANTGSGGGGNGYPNPQGTPATNGGKGLVIIRYKYQ